MVYMHGLVPQNPLELGFPEKFERWRDNQAEAIEESIICNKRIIANCAPTGFGKSQCYMGQAILEGGRTCILTGTKGLQNQLLKDYKSMGLVTIMGKDNYPCAYQPGWTCKDGYAGQCPYKGSNHCPHGKAYNIARTAPYVSTNYKYWIAVHRYGLGLGRFDRLVLDEAHVCPDEIAESMQVKLSFHEIQEMLGSDFPQSTGIDGEAWKTWARRELVFCRQAVQKKAAQIQSKGITKPSWIKDYHHLKNLAQKLGIVALMRAKDWIWELTDTGWQFDPIRFERYAESRLLFNIPKIILYSATLRPKTMYLMGMKDETFHFRDWPSIFDPNRSPVYQIPTMRVDNRSQDYSQLRIRCDQIIGPRLQLERNGIIHVTSFKYRDAIFYGSHYRRQMISHFDDSPSSMAVAKFIEKGGVLISPSVSEGYDFPGDLCRFQILTKIPFRPRSKVLDARQEADKLYGPYNAMQKLVQQAGRGTRSESDWSETFILDDHIQWFANRYHGLAPKAFWQRYKFLATAPKPLEME